MPKVVQKSASSDNSEAVSWLDSLDINQKIDIIVYNFNIIAVRLQTNHTASHSWGENFSYHGTSEKGGISLDKLRRFLY
jgi:hypothetical protein